MTRERWALVRRVFEAVVEEPREHRTARLSALCPADDELQNEVRALLAAHDAATGLLSSSPRPPFASEPLIGRNAGRYQIRDLLGSGGMGIVYRAWDPELNRHVALKVLPAEIFSAAEQARFLREARAASALNHINIVTVFDTGEDAGLHYLAMELVEGRTLAHAIRGGISRHQALEWAIQIAAALEAAHAAGIVHRDIKPGNIMIRHDGVIKVLDFGLGGAADADPGGRGTEAYMSPEQAAGSRGDERSDIYSFGCTLLEILAGKRGRDTGDVPATTPASLRGLLSGCLEPDPNQRLLTATQIAERLRRSLNQRRLRTRSALATAAALLLAVLLWRYWPDRRISDRSSWLRLTDIADSASQPAISPDGKQVAFIRGASTFAGPGQVYVMPITGGTPVRLTNDSVQKMSPAWSPDGTSIAYTVVGSGWDTWLIQGSGPPQPWMANASGLTWTRGHPLYSSILDRDVHMAILLNGADSPQPRKIYVPQSTRAMAHRSAASPDGKWALIVEMDPKAAWLPCRLTPLDGSAPARPVGPPNSRCTAATWSPDGRWMYLTAATDSYFHIWRQRFPNGQPELLTAGPTEEEGIAVAPDGRTGVVSVGLRQCPVSIHDETGENQISLGTYSIDPRYTADGRFLIYRAVKGSEPTTDLSELYSFEIATGQHKPLLPGRLLDGGVTLSYDLAPDGSLIAAAPDEHGVHRLWLLSADGATAPRIIPGIEGDQPAFGDAATIFYRCMDGKSPGICSAHRDGSQPLRITPAARLMAVSPDRGWLIVQRIGIGGQVTALPLRGGDPLSITATLYAGIRWSADARRIFFSIPGSQFWENGGRTWELTLPPGKMFPPIPAEGFQSEREIARIPGIRRIDAFDVAPGPTPSTWAFAREIVQRNLYRIPLP